MGTWFPQANMAQLAQVLAKNPKLAQSGIVPPSVPPVPPMAQAPPVAPPQAPPQAIPPAIARPANAQGSVADLENQANLSRQVPMADKMATQPPAPTDDPGITAEMRKAMAPVQQATQAFDSESQKLQGLTEKYNTLAPPNYEKDFAPHGIRKVAANILQYIPLAPAMYAANVAKKLPEYHRATDEYEQQRTQLGEQIRSEQPLVTLASDRARVAQEGFRNQMDVRKQNETERKDVAGEEIRNSIRDMQERWHQGNIEERDQARLDKIAQSTSNLELKQKIADMTNEFHMRMADAATTRANGGGAPGEGMNKVQQGEFKTRTSEMQRQLQQIDKDRSKTHETMMNYEAGGLLNDDRRKAMQGHLDEYDKQRADVQGKIDKVEQEIMGRGGKGAAPTDGATPAAKPSGKPQLTKGETVRKGGADVPVTGVRSGANGYEYQIGGVWYTDQQLKPVKK